MLTLSSFLFLWDNALALLWYVVKGHLTCFYEKIEQSLPDWSNDAGSASRACFSSDTVTRMSQIVAFLSARSQHEKHMKQSLGKWRWHVLWVSNEPLYCEVVEMSVLFGIDTSLPWLTLHGKNFASLHLKERLLLSSRNLKMKMKHRKISISLKTVKFKC